MIYYLRREEDQISHCGKLSALVTFNPDGSEKTKLGRPTVGYHMRVGAAFVGTFDGSYWTTTEIQEILEDTGDRVRFRTLNSTYIWEQE